MRTAWVALITLGCASQSTESIAPGGTPAPTTVSDHVVESAPQQAVHVKLRRNVFRSFEILAFTVLYKTPERTPEVEANKAGTIAKGTRVGLKSLGPVGNGCDRWVELEPRGWMCESGIAPSVKPPSAARTYALTDEFPNQPLVNGVFGVVAKGAIAYRSVEDIQAGNGYSLAGANTVRGAATIMVDGKRYWQTTRGELISATSVGYIAPSKFKGELIDPEFDVMPAWVRRRGDFREPAITTTTAGKPKRKLAYHTVVTILEESADGKRVRIADDEWIHRGDLRVAVRTDPPTIVKDDERWFDIDTDEQVLVAYEGKQPVYATLVSTGKWGHWTLPVIARIKTKYEATAMNSDQGDEIYSVADVPWTMFYEGNYALHTAYWHNMFGTQRSHGCVNLSPKDARLLYRWSSPDIPTGWQSVHADVENPGSIVRVRMKGFEPMLRGYATKLVAKN